MTARRAKPQTNGSPATRPWLGVLMLSTLLAARQADAAEAPRPRAGPARPRIELKYIAPPGCGSTGEVLRSFEAQWHDPRVDPAEAPLVARAEVQRTHDSLILRFSASQRQRREERTLELANCEAALEATALLLVLMIEPRDTSEDPAQRESATDNASSSSQATEGHAVAGSEEGSQPKLLSAEQRSAAQHSQGPTSESSRGQPQPARRLLTYRVGLGLKGTTGLLPGVGLGPMLALEVARGPAWLALRGSWMFAPDSTSDAFPNARLSAFLAQGELSLGLGFGPSWKVGPYAALTAQWAQLGASGVDDARSGGTPLWAAGGGVALSLPVGRSWGLQGTAGLVVPLERPRFELEERVRPLFQPAEWGGEGSISVIWKFGSQK